MHETLEEGRVLLNIPRIDNKEKRLPTNKPYFLRFFSGKGVFRFTVVLCGYVGKGGAEYMMFQTADDGEKIMNRQSFRLNCSEQVTFCVADGAYLGPPQTGSIRDISSGGIRLKTLDELELRQLLQIDIPMIFPDFRPNGLILSKQNINEAARISLIEQLRGKNLTKQSDSGKVKYMWQYGIAFVGATDEEMEQIIMHVHNKQQIKREEVSKK